MKRRKNTPSAQGSDKNRETRVQQHRTSHSHEIKEAFEKHWAEGLGPRPPPGEIGQRRRPEYRRPGRSPSFSRDGAAVGQGILYERQTRPAHEGTFTTEVTRDTTDICLRLYNRSICFRSRRRGFSSPPAKCRHGPIESGSYISLISTGRFSSNDLVPARLIRIAATPSAPVTDGSRSSNTLSTKSWI